PAWRAREAHQDLELGSIQAVRVQLRGDPAGEPGPRLGEQPGHGQPRVVQCLATHPGSLPRRNLTTEILRAQYLFRQAFVPAEDRKRGATRPTQTGISKITDNSWPHHRPANPRHPREVPMTDITQTGQSITRNVSGV